MRQDPHANTVPSCAIAVCPACNTPVTEVPQTAEVNRQPNSLQGRSITRPPATVTPQDGIEYSCFDNRLPSTTPQEEGPEVLSTTTAPLQAKRAVNSQIYILKVCRTLIIFGAPMHRLERVLTDSYVHAVYKDVIHKRTTLEAACIDLDETIQKDDNYALWIRVLAYGLASASIGPVSYNAQPVDLPIIFILGTLIGFLEPVLIPRSDFYGYVFEISVAIAASLLGRAFGSIHWGQGHSFCFSAIRHLSL
ncbi:uncharacterized protein N7479_000375 [Penicillium vulpinum]|uniref:uncharacterized protein n=1 Tax=Penicillium vulpinum TaxID=29845 RepID=UPI002549ACF3|nr:uncharacterized protein N7479_000375 [Penicillium vulpinum]KAJ5970457.1 hypothetical protein N7479_000375 [Penicillium vulpinum]